MYVHSTEELMFTKKMMMECTLIAFKLGFGSYIFKDSPRFSPIMN